MAIQTVVGIFQSVLKWSHDYDNFFVIWPTGDEWRVIGAWSAVGYQRYRFTWFLIIMNIVYVYIALKVLRGHLYCLIFLYALLQEFEFEFEIWCLTPLSAIFSYIMATSFSGGGSRSTRREPPTMGKQLIFFRKWPFSGWDVSTRFDIQSERL